MVARLAIDKQKGRFSPARLPETPCLEGWLAFYTSSDRSRGCQVTPIVGGSSREDGWAPSLDGHVEPTHDESSLDDELCLVIATRAMY